MSGVKSCVDHDRNIAFEHPADWLVRVDPVGVAGVDVVSLWSPLAPGGAGQVTIVISLSHHNGPGLQAFVDQILQPEPARMGYVLRGRSGGRHPVSRLPTISVSYDLNLDGTQERRERVFIEVSPGVVVGAAAVCPSAGRHLWKDGCRLVFGSLRLADPTRPPLPGRGRQVGVGLPPGCSEQVTRVWMLLDVTAKRLVEAMGSITDRKTGRTLPATLSLGPAAEFEARAYLHYELFILMLGFGYGGEPLERIRQPVVYAIAGRYPGDPVPPETALARLNERLATYRLADEGTSRAISKERALIFAELLTTSGTAVRPAVIDPAKTYKRWTVFTPEKDLVYAPHAQLTDGFRFSFCKLFKDTPDIENLPVEEIDRRFDIGHGEATEWAEREAAGQAGRG